MRNYIYTLVFLMAGMITNAQTPPVTAPTSPQMPVRRSFKDLEVNNIMNFPEKDIKLESLRGKLIILDFGNIGCPPCVEGLLKMDSLQKRFNDKIQIFWVTTNKPEDLDEFLKNNKIGKTVNLPVIAQDTMLAGMFKHSGTPFIAWLDKYANLIGLTYSKFVIPELVEHLIKY